MITPLKKNSDGTYSAIVFEADKPTKKGRIYSKSILLDMCNRFKVSSSVLFGEMDSPSMETISIDRITHQIVDIDCDESGDLIVTVSILSKTPLGKIAQSLLDNNIECYLNSRGMGNVNENNVVDRFDLITFDLVCSPSQPQEDENV